MLEIASGPQMAIKKSRDKEGRGAIADGGIACFYDEQQILSWTGHLDAARLVLPLLL